MDHLFFMSGVTLWDHSESLGREGDVLCGGDVFCQDEAEEPHLGGKAPVMLSTLRTTQQN